MKRTATLITILGLFLIGGAELFAQPGRPTTTIIVKTARGQSQTGWETALQKHGGVPKASIPALDLHVIEVPTAAADAITANLKKDAAFARVEANRPRRWQGLSSS